VARAWRDESGPLALHIGRAQPGFLLFVQSLALVVNVTSAADLAKCSEGPNTIIMPSLSRQFPPHVPQRDHQQKRTSGQQARCSHTHHPPASLIVRLFSTLVQKN
jgi:hypothetical protein